MSRGPYRPVDRRATAKPFRIEERDLQMLAAILEHRFLTLELLLWLFPPNEARTPTKAITAAATKRAQAAGREPRLTGAHVGSNLRKRLREFFHAQLVDRIDRGAGKPRAYAGTKSARQLLRDRRALPERLEVHPAPSAQVFYVEHTLMIARFRIAVALGVAQCPTLDLADSQRESKRLRHVWTKGERRFAVNPDGFLRIVDSAAPEGRNSRAAFFECDRGTMPPDRVLAKYELYARLERSGELAERFGIATARVLTIAPDAQRARTLLNLLTSTSGPLGEMRDRFLFTSEEAYREQPTNVLAAIWRSAAKPDERAALVPSPLPRR